MAKKPAKKELAVDRSNELRYCMLELASAFCVPLATLLEYAKEEDFLEPLWITKYDPVLDAKDEEDRESLVRDITILIDMLPLIKSKSQQDWMTKMIWGVEEELKETSVGYERLAKPALAVGKRVHAVFTYSETGQRKSLFATVLKAARGDGKWLVQFDDNIKRTLAEEDIQTIVPEVFSESSIITAQYKGCTNAELNFASQFWYGGRILEARTDKLNTVTYTIKYTDNEIEKGVHAEYIMR